MFELIRQEQPHTCGKAVILMLCRGFGAPEPFFVTPRDGISERFMLSTLRGSGLRCAVYRRLLPGLMRERLHRELSRDRGVILYDFDREHWQLAVHIQGDEVAVNDPASPFTQWLNVHELPGYCIAVSG